MHVYEQGQWESPEAQGLMCESEFMSNVEMGP